MVQIMLNRDVTEADRQKAIQDRQNASAECFDGDTTQPWEAIYVVKSERVREEQSAFFFDGDTSKNWDQIGRAKAAFLAEPTL